MNDSLVILLLYLSTCHATELYGSPPSDILPKTKWQKKIETPLEVSCPDPADIEPCECTNVDYLAMNCSNVLDEEQLRNVFAAFFPSTEFLEFRMYENHGVKVLEDGVFGNVSFQILDIFSSDLETVQADALTSSLSTLTVISIESCKLEIFPFERLAEFTSLEDLDLFDNKISTFPPLSSSSIEILGLSWNLITHLPSDAFTLLPGVKLIYLNGNLLTEIPKGTFTDLPELEYVSLFYNNISYLQSLTFDVVFSPSYTIALDIHNNNIEYVEVDTFKGVSGSANISLAYNALTRLLEEAWRPVLEKNTSVSLAGNDLMCGCDLAWLVGDSQLLPMVSDARCADGTLLTDLNPADFDICG